MRYARADRGPEAVDAAGIDDMAFLRLLQHRQEGAGAVVDAAPADVERLFPLLAAMREHAAATANTGIVEEKMELIGAVPLGDLVAKSRYLRRVGHVGGVHGYPQSLRQPRCLAQPPGFHHAFFDDIAHRDIAGLSGQLADELSPHSRAAAGNDCDPAREFFHCRLLRVRSGLPDHYDLDPDIQAYPNSVGSNYSASQHITQSQTSAIAER